MENKHKSVALAKIKTKNLSLLDHLSLLYIFYSLALIFIIE